MDTLFIYIFIKQLSAIFITVYINTPFGVFYGVPETPLKFEVMGLQQ